MLVLGELSISLQSYLYISLFFTIWFILYFIKRDLDELGWIDVIELIRSLSEALLIGLSWIVSIPILTLSNIILLLIAFFLNSKYGKEDEFEEGDE